MQDFKKISSIALLLGCFCSPSAQAIMSNPFGWYFDANLGYTKISDIKFNNGSTNNNGFGGNITLGYKFMPYFGLEIGYSKYSNTSIADQSCNKAGELQAYSYDLALKAIMPVYDSGMEIFGKIGAQRTHTRFSIKNLYVANYISMTSHTESRNGLYAGLGGQYYFMPEFAVVGQWARAVGNANVGTWDLYTIGITFIFG